MSRARIVLRLLEQAPLLLFLAAVVGFGAVTPRFLTGANLLNICVQSAPTGIVEIGMTLVLSTAGVDLSVGAVMFVTAAVAGKLALAGAPLIVVMGVMLLIGAGIRAFNGMLITRLPMTPFIVTLATLFIGRGFSLWLTQTRAMNLPASYLSLGSGRVFGVPLPMLVLLGAAFVFHALVTRTPCGRQLHATGENAESARLVGIATSRIVLLAYATSGLMAGLGSVLLFGQLGAVTPKFGENYEFKAIAAAVLGGTSLFGGRGAVLPGTLLGALLIQSVENALVLRNADPYLYPLIASAESFPPCCWTAFASECSRG